MISQFTRRIATLATAAAVAGAGLTAVTATSASASASTSASARMDSCTGFCVDVRNGLNRSVWMKGTPGWFLIPSGQWSDDATNGTLQDVDWIEVPGGCSIFFRGTTYRQYEQIRIRGTQPYIWLVGIGC